MHTPTNTIKHKNTPIKQNAKRHRFCTLFKYMDPFWGWVNLKQPCHAVASAFQKSASDSNNKI